MNFKKTIQTYLWALPFLMCLAGYLIPIWFTPKTTMTTPQLVHSNLHDALVTCSAMHLNLQIIHEQYDAHIPQGTILDQKPAAQEPIKQHQTVFVNVAKTPDPIYATNCIGKSEKEITKIEQQEHIKIKRFALPSILPAGSCIAQTPLPQEPLLDKKMIIYTAQKDKNLYICPRFIGKPADDCAQQCLKYHIEVAFFHENHPHQPPNLQDWTVINQKPMPGTFINPEKDSIQLEINPN